VLVVAEALGLGSIKPVGTPSMVAWKVA